MTTRSDRILTTHVGSLPRPEALSQLLLAKEFGEPFDVATYEAEARLAVADAVRRQREAGIDIISDGEMSKIGYATYIKDRCTGYSGESPRNPPADLERFPAYLKRSVEEGQSPKIVRPMCTGEVAIKNSVALEADVENFQKAYEGCGAVAGFMNAASPGVIAAFLPNSYYPSDEAYLEALAVVMRDEYEAIHAAGFLVQIDCPDVAMARHIWFKELDDADFVKRAELNVEILNHALENIPADRARMHVCWGNYEGPHDCDIELSKIVGVLCRAKPHAISFEAANPRHAHEWSVWRESPLPEDKLLMPGVVDSSSNFIEHPEYVAERICRFADVVGRERVIASSDCGFGTFATYGRVDPDISYAKLRTLSEGAEIASAKLW
ncbi:MAG: cobalamin-independent methionine synthase II family protein [Myxococcales bacterium]|nr:cobalamin-independent methionine synthase II family protein [Myxococcales bacterium]